MTNEQKEIIKTLRAQGQSVSQIESITGVSANTIKAFLRREQQKRARCKHCGQSITHLPGHKAKVFCDDACRRAWWKDHRDQVGHTSLHHHVCAHCGRGFHAPDKIRTYCCHPCYIAARFGVP